MEELISVIIPVYQVEEYLPECLDSVLGQTYHNLDIILIDDGSPDGCGQICDDYAARDARIRVIHKQNEGVARARNDGIEAARGAYISFLDSDDWIAEDAYERLYQGMQQYHADCVVGGCVNVVDRAGRLTPCRRRRKASTECLDTARAMERVLLRGSAVWNRLFRRSVFETLRFPVDRINDDEVTALRAYGVCKKIVFLAQDTYYYRIRKDSITTSAFSLKKLDFYYNSRDNLRYIRKTMPGLSEAAEYKYLKTMLYCYVHLLRIRREAGAAEALGRLRGAIRKNRARAWKNRYLPLSMKLLFVLCGNSSAVA